MADLQIGDNVWHREKRLYMKVDDLHPGGLAHCAWTDDNEVVHKECFHPSVLKKEDPPNG